MPIKLSKGKKILFYIAIMMTNVVTMHDIVILPIANIFYAFFPNSVAGVNFVISGPAIIMFISSLLVPYLLKIVSKKSLLSVSCIIFTISSLCEGLIISLPYIIFLRSLCGFCYGIIQVIILGIVADYFIDEDKRATFMGFYNTAMAAIGALMGIMAGTLAVSSWNHAFATYLLAIPMTILVIFFIPKFASIKETVKEEIDLSNKKVNMGTKFWIALATFMIYGICYAPIFTMSAVYVNENGLGNEAYTGIITSIGTIGSACCCLVFGLLYKKLKARTSLISYGIMAISLTLMFFVPNSILFIIICVATGGAYGMLFSYIYAIAPSIVLPQNISKAISYITAGTGFSMFISTYAMTGLMGVMRTTLITPVTLVLAVIIFVCFVIEVISTKHRLHLH